MPGGRTYQDVVTVGGIDIYNVTSDPSGSLDARIGSLAIRSDPGQTSIWQNSDGLTSWSAIVGASSPSGKITVAAAGADFTTITAALASALPGNVVKVFPGTYPENITIPTGVRLVGSDVAQTVRIIGADTGSSRVIMSAGSTIRDVTVVGTSTGVNPAIDASGLLVNELVVINGVIFQGAGAGPLVDGPGAGLMVLKACRHNGGAVAGSAIVLQGGGQVYLQEFLFGFGSSVAAVEVGNVDLELQTLTFTPGLYTATTGIWLSNAASKLQGNAIMFPDFGASTITNALRISADGCQVSLQSTHLHGAVYDLLVDPGLLGTGSIFAINGEMTLERRSIPDGWASVANSVGIIIDEGIENDATSRSIGELAVGTVDNPAEITIGNGDSLACLSAWTYDASTATWTDVTAEARSRGGAGFTMPGDVGDRLYVGYDRPFVNLRTNLVSVAVLGAGTIIDEQIWTGAAYESIRTMDTDANHPYEQHGQRSFINETQEQIYLDISGDTDPDSPTFGEPYSQWTQEDPMGSGTPYYYLMFEVTVANLAVPAVIQRLKCGFNRWEGNSDGFPQNIGQGQGQRKALPSTGRRAFTGGGSPSSATFNLSPGVQITVPQGTFANGGVDGFEEGFMVLRGVDTSREMSYTVEWTVSGVASGDVELEIIASLITDGSNIDSGALAEISDQKVVTVTAANDDGVKNKTTFYFSVPEARNGDTVSVALYRDARGSNPDDTLAASIKIFDTDLRAVRWTTN